MYLLHRRVTNGDHLSAAFKIIKENGMKRAVEYLVAITFNPSSLVPIRRDFRDVELGDHLVCKTTSGWNIHFYVAAVIGKGKIRVIGTFLEGNEDPFIEEKLIFRPKKAEQLKIRERILHEAQIPKHNDMKKMLHTNLSHFVDEKSRLESYRVQKSLYNFLYNNSEHFLTFIKTGISTCQSTAEVENVLKKFIFANTTKNINKEATNHAIASGSWALLLAAYKSIVTSPETESPARLAVREVLQADDVVKRRTAALQTTKYTVAETIKRGGQITASRSIKPTGKEIGRKIATVQESKGIVKGNLKGGSKGTTNQVNKGRKGGGGGTVQANKDIVKVVKNKGIVKGGCKGTTDQANIDTVNKEYKENADQASKNIYSKECKGATAQVSEDVVVKDGYKGGTTQASDDIVKEKVKGESEAAAIQGAVNEAVKTAAGGKATSIQTREGVNKEVAMGESKAALPTGAMKINSYCTTSETNSTKNANSTVLIQPSIKEILDENRNTEATQPDSGVQQVYQDESTEVLALQSTKQSSSAISQQVSDEVVNQTAKNVTSATARNTATVAAQHTLRATVFAQLAVEGALYSVQMGRAVYKHMKGQMDQEEFVDYTVKQTATSGGSAAGGISGSLAGAAAGAAFGSVFPIVGTAVGSLVGGVMGGIGGGVGGSFLGKETGKAITSIWKESNKWQEGVQNPGSITTTSNGELIVLDSSASQAFIFSSGLSLIKVFTFTGEGRIIEPEGIAAGDVIAISDRKKNIVKLFSTEGKYVSTIGSRLGSKEGQFDFPLGLCFNSKGILYVVDCCNFRVQAFDTNQNNAFCGIVGSEGSGPGQFKHPEYIAIDSSDHIYVTDYASNCINMYRGDDHTFVCKISCNRPCAIALSPDNHLIVGDRENNCLYVFNHPHDKGYLRQLSNIIGSKGCGRGEFNAICGLAVNEQGTIYIAESENNRLQAIGTSVWRKAMLETAAQEKF